MKCLILTKFAQINGAINAVMYIYLCGVLLWWKYRKPHYILFIIRNNQYFITL